MRTKFRASMRSRSRIITPLVLIVVAVPIVLANFAPSDYEYMGFPLARPEPKFEYGWPLIWYWRQTSPKPGQLYVLCYGWASLIGNVAIWSVILAATGTATDRLVRRYRLALRWSLRKLLAAVAMVSVLCACCASLRERAKIQDPLIAEIERRIEAGNGFGGDGLVNLERWGPKWLDIVGADPFRRRIVGVQLYNYDDSTRPGLLNRLGRLPGLRFLHVEADAWTPEMIAALGDLRQLRALHVAEIGTSYDDYDDRFPEELFGIVGKLKQLQVLTVKCSLVSSDNLRHVAGLTDLRSLRLEIQYVGESEGELQDLVAMRSLATLADLPATPRLEFLGFYGGIVRADDLRQLGKFRRLKALDLTPEFVTDGALVELASLESVEELAIGGEVAGARGLESLASLKRLKRLHIPPQFLERIPIRVDGTGEVFVPQTDRARCRRALEALRQANPGVVIDCGNPTSFAAYRTFDRLRSEEMLIHRWPQ